MTEKLNYSNPRVAETIQDWPMSAYVKGHANFTIESNPRWRGLIKYPQGLLRRSRR